MSSFNEILLEGDYNTVIQGVNARDISIVISDNLPPETKKKKKELAEKIQKLAFDFENKLNSLKKEVVKEDDCEPDPETFQLVTALEAQKCVLFVGPEIAIAENSKNSLHEQFYIENAKKTPDSIYYDENEGLFLLDNEFYFHALAYKYYSKEFDKKNKHAQQILEKLSSLPFKLTVDFSPDNTLNQIYNKYDIPHNYVYYKDDMFESTKSDDKGNPLLVNVLGSAVENRGRFIYTYSDLYKYIRNAKIPPEIKHEIQTASHYIFIGFDFKKWNNRLLLYVLGINENSKNYGRLIEHQSVQEIEEYMAKQFNIKLVKSDYKTFSDNLDACAKSNNIGINLKEFLYKHQLVKLKNLSSYVVDEKSKQELDKVDEVLNLISQKLN